MTPKPIEATTPPPIRPDDGPILSWEPVDGATQYRLVVLTADGETYWAWSGSTTSVALGGDDDTAGHRFVASLTWQVTAYDAAGVPVAFSGTHTVEP